VLPFDGKLLAFQVERLQTAYPMARPLVLLEIVFHISIGFKILTDILQTLPLDDAQVKVWFLLALTVNWMRFQRELSWSDWKL
jgi:hypothetical protein